jgi:hypothetical protein
VAFHRKYSNLDYFAARELLRRGTLTAEQLLAHDFTATPPAAPKRETNLWGETKDYATARQETGAATAAADKSKAGRSKPAADAPANASASASANAGACGKPAAAAATAGSTTGPAASTNSKK